MSGTEPAHAERVIEITPQDAERYARQAAQCATRLQQGGLSPAEVQSLEREHQLCVARSGMKHIPGLGFRAVIVHPHPS